MKVNVSSALVDGVVTELSAAPKRINGKLLIPSEALALIGIEREDELTDYDSISEAHKLYDPMGLIFIDHSDDILSINREDNLNYMSRLANSICFKFPRAKMSGTYDPASESEREEFMIAGQFIADMIEARGYVAHPHLFANDDVFSALREIYISEDGSKECERLKAVVKYAYDKRKMYPELDESGNIKEPIESSGYGESEYDEGGRHSNSEAHASNCMHLAFAYQITGDTELARIAYHVCAAISERKHWGPGHFLNCAGAAGYAATVYDWLYNVWRELGLDTGVIKRGIYKQGLHHAYNSVIFDTCDFPSKKQGTGWRFKAKRDNWNAVCNGGIITAALCLMTEGADEALSEEEYLKVKELIGACLSSITQDGHVYNQYLPDGSYVESNSYWSYGTSRLFYAMAVLKSTIGTDLGMHDGCGLDKTCYYAMNSESAEFVGWNYHDGSLSQQDTSLFNMFATISGDHKLYAVRETHLSAGKSASLFDMLYCPRVLGIEAPALDDMPLDYYMEGIDAFTVRSGWEKGSLYAGMMGGVNAIGGSHNQIDSGSFVYHNLGKLWITDLGSDNYNMTKNKNGEGYFSNYELYRRNGEGANAISLHSLPYGQLMGKRGVMTDTYSSDTLSYCVIDNTAVYGKDTVKSAKRGMLLLDGRKTLVVADEIKFEKPDTAFWIANFESEKINADISDDGKACRLTHSTGEEITLSIVTEGAAFEKLSTYDFLLSGTHACEGEHSRDSYSRLVIRFENVTELTLSVVISENGYGSYKAHKPIDEWASLK